MQNHMLRYTDIVLTRFDARATLKTPISVSYYTNQKNKRSVLHSHPFFELILPLHGSKVRYSMIDNTYTLALKDLIIIPPNTEHEVEFSLTSSISERIVLQVDAFIWQNCIGILGLPFLDHTTVYTKRLCSKFDFPNLFYRMSMCNNLNGTMQNTLYETYIREFLLLLNAHSSKSIKRINNSLTQKAINYLQQNFKNPNLTVNLLAKKLYVTREHLSRTFSEHVLASISTYLLRLRLEYCCQLLYTTSMSVTDICYNSGFSSYESFFRAFKVNKQCSPKEYREKYSKL